MLSLLYIYICSNEASFNPIVVSDEQRQSIHDDDCCYRRSSHQIHITECTSETDVPRE